jgi:hypothetical protein
MHYVIAERQETTYGISPCRLETRRDDTPVPPNVVLATQNYFEAEDEFNRRMKAAGFVWNATAKFWIHPDSPSARRSQERLGMSVEEWITHVTTRIEDKLTRVAR